MKATTESHTHILHPPINNNKMHNPSAEELNEKRKSSQRNQKCLLNGTKKFAAKLYSQQIEQTPQKRKSYFSIYREIKV